MLKPVTFAFALLGLSCSAFAGSPGNAMVIPTGVVLTAPDSYGAWSFGLEAMYVQPTGSNFQYTQVNNLVTGSSSNQSVNPGYSFGGEADLTYRFAGSSRDISLGYTHLNTDDTDSTNVSGLEILSQSVALLANSAKAETDNDYNAVDLNIGQQFLVGDRVVLHPFMGLRYADVDQDNKVTFTNSTFPTSNGVEKVDSDFQGVGPRAGIDVRVLTGGGFSVLGTMGGALLVGDTDSKIELSNNNPFGRTPIEYKNDDSINVVPELDGRLALDYTPHAFFPEASVGFQLGYEVVHYFDVANLDASSAAQVNSVDTKDSFGYQGPYFRLQLNFT